MKFLRSLAYRTERKGIKTIDDVKAILAKESNFKAGKVCLPYKQEWQKLYAAWQDTSIKDDVLFLRDYFGVTNQTKYHNKTRKDFSLPASTAEGKILIRRKNWDNKYTYQILNDSDSRTDGSKPFIPAFDINNQKITEAMVSSFVSKDVFWLPKNISAINIDNKSIFAIDTSRWVSVEIDEDLMSIGIEKLEYKIDNNTRPKIRVLLKNKVLDSNINEFLSDKFLKSRYVDKLRDSLSLDNLVIEYESSGFNKSINKLLATALMHNYNETPNN